MPRSTASSQSSPILTLSPMTRAAAPKNSFLDSSAGALFDPTIAQPQETAQLDAVGAVADGADEVFEQVFQCHHGDHVAVGIGDQGEVAVAAAQPG